VFHLGSVGKVTQQLEFLVVEVNQATLLSAKVCEALGLLTGYIVNCVAVQPATLQDIQSEFGDIFECLWKLPGEYQMDIDSTVKPIQHHPRKVPEARKNDLRKEIDGLVVKGVFEKVTTPTDWINSMVVVRKVSGKLHIYIDTKNLNVAIKRSHYTMTTVEDISSKPNQG